MTSRRSASDIPLSEQLLRLALKRCREPSEGAQKAAARTLFDVCGCVVGAGNTTAPWPLDHAGRIAVSAHLCDQDDLHLD